MSASALTLGSLLPHRFRRGGGDRWFFMAGTDPATTRSAVMMAAMVVIATVIARGRELHRFEFERGHTGGDIESGLPLHAHWL